MNTQNRLASAFAMDDRIPNQLSTEATAQFRLGIDLLFSRWPSLQIVIYNGWGGRQIVEQCAADIVSHFSQTTERVYVNEVEEILSELMLSLNTAMDDGSIEEIAEKIKVMHAMCLKGNFTIIERLKESPPPRVTPSHIRQGLNDDEDD